MAMRGNTVDWQVPAFEYSDEKKLGFVKQAIDHGTKWVEDKTSSTDIQAGINLLSGKSNSDLSSSWAGFTTGDLKRSLREIIETLSNIRLSFAGFQTANRAYLEHTDMMNKVAQAVYLKSFVDRSLRDALQFGALTGMGGISPGYARSLYGSGKGNFVFEPLSQLDCLPVQLPRNRNYQEAYVVTLARTLPIAKGHALFPAFQDKLKPFAKNKYLKGGEVGQRQYRASRWALHSMSQDMEQYCDVFYSYVLDLRINDKPWGENTELAPLPMGQVGTSWFYEVPFVGQEIERWEDGRLRKRLATDEDCRVYPRRRLMISCDSALMYDGPAFDWHGMVPLVPFYLDDWAWEGTGNSLFTDTAPLQGALDDLVRSMYRIAMARVRPSKSYNTDTTTPDLKGARLSNRQAETIDPFATDITLGIDGDIKEPVMRPLMPEWCYQIPEQEFKVCELLVESIKHVLGLDQIQALQKLRANIQNPEQLLEAEGPVVTGTSRSMESGIAQLGQMMGCNILQYMPTGVVIQLVGADQVPQQVFDYDPSSLIPSHLPGEETTKSEMVDGQMISVPVPSAHTQDFRARQFADNMEYTVVPHSLHEIAQNKKRLTLLAVMQKGLPIDPETLSHEFDVANWGILDGATIMDKLVDWAKKQVMMKADIAKLEAGLGLNPAPEQGGEGHKATGGPKGRPNTNKKAPQLRQKGLANSTPGRAVVTTS